MDQPGFYGTQMLSALELQVERMGNSLLESEIDTFLLNAQEMVKAVAELRRCASAQQPASPVSQAVSAERARLNHLVSKLQDQRDALARRAALVDRTLEVLLPGRAAPAQSKRW